MAEVSSYDIGWQDDVGDLATSFTTSHTKKRRKTKFQKFTSDNNFDEKVEKFATIKSPPDSLMCRHKKPIKMETPPLLKQQKLDSAQKSVNETKKTNSIEPEPSTLMKTNDAISNFTLLLKKLTPAELGNYDSDDKKSIKAPMTSQVDILNDMDDSIFESSSFLASVDRMVCQMTQKQPEKSDPGQKNVENDEKIAMTSSNTVRTPQTSRPQLKSFNEDWDNDSPFNRPSFLAQLDEICPTGKPLVVNKDRTPELSIFKNNNAALGAPLVISQTPQPLYASTPVCQSSSMLKRKARLFTCHKQKLNLDDVEDDDFFVQTPSCKSTDPKSTEL